MSNTFSESWFLVAQLRVAMQPGTKVHKQHFRGINWYVLQDPCSGRFFRLQEIAYRFVSSLSVNLTIEEHWQNFVERFPEQAPGQEDVIQLLSQLHHSSLLFFRSEADTETIFERVTTQERKEHLSKLMAFMYLKVPLFDPDPLLERFGNYLKPIFSFTAFFLWLLTASIGVFTVFENWPALVNQTQGVLAPDNIFLLYISMFGLKLCHEFGHAIALKRFGGKTTTLGLMFIVLTPLPYVDASQSWSLKQPRYRAVVGFAGMYVELFLASLAAVLWANTAPGIINSLAFNVMMIGSISSLLFNGNPLLKFDAYYIASDLLNLPNLFKKSSDQWLYYFNKYLLGTRDAESPAFDAYERAWYTFYGFSSYFYRLAVVFIIAIYAADLWIGLGIAMAIVSLSIWVFIPMGKLIKFLLTSNEIRHNKPRAWMMSLGLMSLVVIAIFFVPVPYNVKAPGVVQAETSVQIYSDSGGVLDSAILSSGQAVKAGDVIASFTNDDLVHEKMLISQQLNEVNLLIRQALDKGQADIHSLTQQKKFLSEQLTEIAYRLSRLSVVAPFDGIWVPNKLKSRLGSYIGLDEELGTLYDNSRFNFVAVVSQEDASDIFGYPLNSLGMKLLGQNYHELNLESTILNPYKKSFLPSGALGWEAGGPVMSTSAQDGRVKAVEPFFEVISYIDSPPDVILYEGMTGWALFRLPPRSLFWQLRQSVLQLVQQRYQI
ncbi:hypothetical protein [Oceanospirillum sanctuarii]|uniref:hypothetical protein n=1 Tax=Oceanospirillum sanctuarii TaxID=1434821 RepID=UPI000A3845F8|nr:hypothetical protein [Oceanospirillum sanctuarii]